MRIPQGRWGSVILGLAAIGILCVRFLGPHFTDSSSRKAVQDSSLASPLNQPGGGEVPPEAYEVYSALYQQPQEALALVEASRTDIPQVNGSCLRPTTSDEHEMASAFTAANGQSHLWERKFNIPSGYLLLKPQEIQAAQKCITSREKVDAGCDDYRSLKHIRFLGVPGFDHTHTHALVSVIKMCGNQCGSGGIFEVEKSGGQWKRSEPSDFFSNCSWMY